ncbi:GNAT family N-acetyltransferase [Deinococcus yavapaiensis]|uniref:Acetyltransferase (GNAT) family protein n=1 Tax=Deinococcus yavapaiensis KR-236 TaxID=694435 RepID=A0A318RYR0_9DEIO|nr:GNAT family N-acetyltransferase [Deinococcus yavapaiensis]PYE47702.1 acetyltransferase (GNAT) family protein [Deinococcus yavapaiensis KR-236]
MSHRPYRDDADFRVLLDFLSRVNVANSQAGYLHPGDLTWWIRQNTVFDPQEGIELFHDDAGKLLGFVFNKPPEWATLQAAPHTPSAVLDEMLAFAQAKAAANTQKSLTVAADAGDEALTRALERADFSRTGERMCCFVYRPVVQGVPTPTLPNGFSFSSVTDDPDLKAKRVALHRAVWHPSKVTLEAYEHLRAAPSYRADLDMVLVAPDGALAAYALGWYDPQTRNGIQEPVGTHPDFRKRGLGQLVVQEVTRRLIVLGAEKISIYTFERLAAAMALYKSVGYTLSGYVEDWQRNERVEVVQKDGRNAQ